SKASSMMACEAASSVFQPKFMVPRHIGLTFTPVLPSLTYSILVSSKLAGLRALTLDGSTAKRAKARGERNPVRSAQLQRRRDGSRARPYFGAHQGQGQLRE